MGGKRQPHRDAPKGEQEQNSYAPLLVKTPTTNPNANAETQQNTRTHTHTHKHSQVEAIKERLLANNALTYWVPSYVKDKRFHNWLEGAHDWAVSRSRCALCL